MCEHVHFLDVASPLQNRRSRTSRCAKMYTSLMSLRHYKTSEPGRTDVRNCTLLANRFAITKQPIQDAQMYENAHLLEVCSPLQNKRSRTRRCAKMYTSWRSVRHYKTSDPGRPDVEGLQSRGAKFGDSCSARARFSKSLTTVLRLDGKMAPKPRTVCESPSTGLIGVFGWRFKVFPLK